MLEYQARDELLKNLGFPSYSHYLGGELWKAIRKVVLATNPRCPCGRKAWQVHHREYTREALLGDDLSPLVSICSRCHKWIEFVGDRKCSLAEANARLAGIAAHRVKSARWCSCGNRAKKGSDFCWPCIRKKKGIVRGPSIKLPMCQGVGCRSQAAVGRKYCRRHEVFNGSPCTQEEYKTFLRRMALARGRG